MTVTLTKPDKFVTIMSIDIKEESEFHQHGQHALMGTDMQRQRCGGHKDGTVVTSVVISVVTSVVT